MRDEERLDSILAECATGTLPPPVAAMRLLMEAKSLGSAEAALARADVELGANPRIRNVARLVAKHPSAWSTIHAIGAAVRHETPSDDPVEHWARLFDNAVQVSPEGSVALYSLGSPELLTKVTDELVGVLDRWNVLGPGRAVLDVGCGIGRLDSVLAGRVGSIVGVDIAPAMIEQARQRCAELFNVSFILGSGRDLVMVEDASVDLVLFVDTFPYLVLSGGDLAARHVAEAARVLRPQGDLVIFNLSYRDDPTEDLADLARFGAASGLTVRRANERLCRLWDAPAFHLVKG
ncbi:class I SAM-dependent methyltransferase [Microvirga subterranea]|uniref:Methyltransferase family protein n=1 Tax=Microvirga subterranea TaxID=186651 RepID=A0A370HQ03_9HYPH|nr:class I SAM-dependent methyltransferase [Microvirga subterranea]RDI60021.1 methyltransferase family protein [Microvirga subterranea]